jgi:hypothetical protein
MKPAKNNSITNIFFDDLRKQDNMRLMKKENGVSEKKTPAQESGIIKSK